MFGCGVNFFQIVKGESVLVVNVMGNLFMEIFDDLFVVVECEFVVVFLGEVVDVVFVDMYVEVISEKNVMGVFCDGCVSLVVGIYIYILIVDVCILFGGMGYQIDVGMCGDYDSVIGMDKEELVRCFIICMCIFCFEFVIGEVILCGVMVEIGVDGLVMLILLIWVGGVFVLQVFV